MATHLYLAPAGHGKTAYTLDRIHQLRSVQPLSPLTVILPNQTQLTAFRHRLSAGGGALGVNLGTFYTLYAEILNWAGRPAPRLPEPVQYRLLRSIVARLSDQGVLRHYASLRDKPGFVTTLRTLMEELKRARIRRDEFRQAVESLGRTDTRLSELAEIYTAYQDWLLEQGWVDVEGQGWLAALALERQPDLGHHMQLLIVDGFDEFNPTQLAVLKLLARRAAETIVTLTGTPDGAPRPALRRFSRALQAIRRALALEPEPLPESATSHADPTLTHLEANLFELRSSAAATNNSFANNVAQASDSHALTPGPVTFIETQNRAEEVRAALRWLKARLVRDKLAPGEVALIARNLAPYRPFIEETAAEFGLTIHLREGLNLALNPAIAALMSLLALPLQNSTEGNWARRPLLDAWRNPYFEKLTPGLPARAADQLDAVARQGLVMQGLEQWREALAQARDRAARHAERPSPPVDEDLVPPDYLPVADVQALQEAFEAFVSRLSPPPRDSLREYAAFVEDLIGLDPELEREEDKEQTDSSENAPSLGMVSRARQVPATKARDIAALRAFKDVLRGLVLAESYVLGPEQPAATAETILYDRFYDELLGAVQGATYYPPPPESTATALPVLSVLNARGLSFRAVALLGLSEGEFPQAEREDILLREEDRQALRQAGLSELASRLRGDEITLFYEAITRAREKLLLCRPYLADDGQKWEPSPYWQQVRRLVDAPVIHLRPEDSLPPREVASAQELAQWAALTQIDLTEAELAAHLPMAELERLFHSAAVLRTRLAAEPQGRFEGDLAHLAERFATAYGPDYIWSASRLEAYGLCPHHFWLGQDLDLEAHQPPEEGFDVFILGSMYHEILEEVYRQAGAEADRERLLGLLPAVAETVFDRAPTVYGFRPTPLWEMQRRELEQILAETLVALAEATANQTPLAQEQVFGMREAPPLVVRKDGTEFRMRGFIDRVDQTADGRLCIIDYKSGSTPIAARDLGDGRRLQIALYALAVREALGLGQIADGFYWHIGSAKASSLKLASYESGVEEALQTAVAHAASHVANVRAGHFPPLPPAAGCPGHCPGASFCWRYKAKGW